MSELTIVCPGCGAKFTAEYARQRGGVCILCQSPLPAEPTEEEKILFGDPAAAAPRGVIVANEKERRGEWE